MVCLSLFYSCLKDEGSGVVIKRIFITGVTSIQLDSMTSVFSIAKNLSVRPQFASMFGFTEEELRSLIPELVDIILDDFTLSSFTPRKSS